MKTKSKKWPLKYRIEFALWDFQRNHSDFPYHISIVALTVSILTLLLLVIAAIAPQG